MPIGKRWQPPSVTSILNDVDIAALNDLSLLNNNQIVVQVPVSVAANVCDVAVNVLARDKSGGTAALPRVVRTRWPA